jgi:hypothetical protein
VSDYKKFFQPWRRSQQVVVHIPRATVRTHRRSQYQGVCTKCQLYYLSKGLRWSTGSVLAFRTQVRGFKPGRRHRNFSGRKTSSERLPSEGKWNPSCPMSQICGVYKKPKNSVNPLLSGQIYRLFLDQWFHLSLLGSLTSLWRAGHLEMLVGTSKISGCTIRLWAAVHLGALANGTQH